MGKFTINTPDTPDTPVAAEVKKQAREQPAQQQQTHTHEEMREFLQSILDVLAASVAVLDSDGTILTVNRAWKRFSVENGSLSPTAYVGQNYLTICDNAPGLMAAEARLATAGIRAVIAGHQPEFYLEYACHSPTQNRWFSMRVTHFTEAAPRRVVVAHTNITERIEAEAAERAQQRFTEALRDSLAALTSSLDVDTVMQQILASAATVVPCEAGRIILFEGQQGRVAHLRGFAPAAIAVLHHYCFTLDTATIGHLLSDQPAYFMPDTQVKPGWLSLPATEWVRSSIGIPIVIRGKLIGLLIADSATPHYFQPADYEKLQLFAHYASLALENAFHVSTLEQRVAARTAELQAAKVRVEAILNNSLDGILLIQPDFRIEQTNQIFCTLLTCQYEECQHRSLLDFIHPDDVEQIIVDGQRAIDTPIGILREVRVCRRDGSTFDAELSISRCNGEGLVCTIRDITERKRNQTALAEERTLLRTVIDSIPDLIYVKDLQHRFLLYNRAVGQVAKPLSTDEFIGKTDLDLLPAYLAERFHADEAAIFRTGTALINHEEQVISPNGAARWLSTTKAPLYNLNGEIIGLAGIGRDITERKRFEQQLRYFASLQQNVNDAVISTDLEMRIQSWNKAAETIYGWSSEEAIGKISPDLLQTQPLAGESAGQTRKKLLKQGSFHGEVSQRRKDGTVVHCLASANLFQDEHGVPVGIVLVNHDITERKYAEAALHTKLEDEQEFQHHLKALHEITIELAQTEDVDHCYRRAIELGLERLGFDRLGILRYDAERDLALGAYGTDPQGRVIAEHHLQLRPADYGGILKRSLESTERFCFDEEAELYSSYRSLGFGWNAMAVLWNGQQILGWLGADNGIHHKPMSKSLLEILALYSLTLGVLLAHKQATAALSASEQKFRRLVEAAPVAIIISDQAKAITLVNDQAEFLFGYVRAELLGQSIETLLPGVMPTDHLTHDATHTANILTQRGVAIESLAKRKDGAFFPVEIDLSHIETAAGLAVMSFITDISEYKRAEAALREQRDFLQLIIDNVPDFITVKDRHGCFELVNQATAQIYGMTPAAMIGRRESEIHPNPVEISNFQQQDQQALASGQTIFIPEEPFGDRYYQTNVIPLQNGAGQADRLLVVGSDITERKCAEEVLQQALQKEKELGELKSRFVSMASHEFRTPLASILVLTETLTVYRHRLTDEQIVQRLGKIQEQVGRLKEIMDDVLQLARIHAHRMEFNPTALDLQAVCAEIIEELQQSQPAVAQRVHYTYDEAIPLLPLDKRLIWQIVGNLLSNALKYSDEEQHVEVKLAHGADEVVLQVRDQGIGIPVEDMKRLFQPFHRATNVGAISGTGLGLSITKESVELHGGAITVESQVGVGTTFTVTLPITSSPEKAEA